MALSIGPFCQILARPKNCCFWLVGKNHHNFPIFENHHNYQTISCQIGKLYYFVSGKHIEIWIFPLYDVILHLQKSKQFAEKIVMIALIRKLKKKMKFKQVKNEKNWTLNIVPKSKLWQVQLTSNSSTVPYCIQIPVKDLPSWILSYVLSEFWTQKDSSCMYFQTIRYPQPLFQKEDHGYKSIWLDSRLKLEKPLWI